MPREIPPLAEVRRTTEKKRDAWWTVLLVDPVATPLVRWTARWTRITPNQITWFALLLGLGAAGCFAAGSWGWLLAGAALYHVSFILDCMDGKLARLTGTGSVFGAWLDYVFDRVRVLACAVALMGGQYHRTGDVLYLWLALAVVFLDMLRYIDALQIFKIRHGMRKQIKARVRAARRAENARELAFMEDLLRDNPEADAEHGAVPADLAATGVPVGDGLAFDDAAAGAFQDGRAVAATFPQAGVGARPGAVAVPLPLTPAVSRAEAGADAGDLPEAVAVEPLAEGVHPGEVVPLKRRPQVVDLHQEFRHRFPWYIRFRSFLLRHRIRTHLVSGIEFQMAVFIVAPLVDAVAPVTVGAGVLLLVFELAIIYKLLLSTRDFTRTMASFEKTA
ncbi:CDP-alcohol phosphatidyltransferase family protein [Streptomyces sp. NPDC001922]|uniref:CDP-alcohol phosphatidyltransferase family protein n=1 Tax=Streptomyces sp. NPDC001922 TaxID=3364624 RepID=UPI0036AA329C